MKYMLCFFIGIHKNKVYVEMLPITFEGDEFEVELPTEEELIEVRYNVVAADTQLMILYPATQKGDDRIKKNVKSLVHELAWYEYALMKMIWQMPV